MGCHELLAPSALKKLAKENTLGIFHLNCRSINNKFDDLQLFFDSLDFSFNVIMFSETWYDDESEYFALDGYKHFFLNRPDRKGGGVSMHVHNSIRAEKNLQFTFVKDDLELLTVESRNNTFSVLYRPQNAKLDAFFETLEALFDYASSNGRSLYLAGDVNVDMKCVSKPGKELEALIDAYGFCNVIEAPTRITCSTATCIDVIITNADKPNINAGTIAGDISDHLPIFAFVNNAGPDTACRPNNLKYRRIDSNTLSNFRNMISANDWSYVLSLNDADRAYDDFVSKIKAIYDASFPLRHARKCKNRKPWITAESIRKIKFKNKLYTQFIKSRDPGKLDIYKKYRNQLNRELKRAKLEYFSNLFDRSSSNSARDQWDQLKRLLNFGTHSEIASIEKEGEVLCGKELSNQFNRFFVNITKALCAPLDVSVSYACGTPSVQETLFMFPTTESEVISMFSHLRSSKSRDKDGFQIQPFKFVIDLLAPTLVHIYNLCLSTGVFPKQMQIAKVAAIHKSGSVSDFSNYRPISILPVLSKALEKIIHCRLSNFLSKHSVLSDCQFGFRKQRSTEMALTKQKEIIIDAFEEKLLAVGIYVDLSKAFDLIDHSVLFQKLSHYGIRGIGLDLIQSYLMYRRQMVCFNGTLSDDESITSGVPQGSILGPLLFLVYLNDIFDIPFPVHLVAYADDITMLAPGNTLAELSLSGNQFLEYLRCWCNRNRLKVNTHKTKAVIYRTKNGVVSGDIELFLGNDKIDIVSSIKSLGVVFSETLNWDIQVDSVRVKMNKLNGLLCKHRLTLPTQVKLLIYNAYIVPVITYCHTVWGTTTKSNKQRLLVAQKRAIRLIANIPWNAHTEEYFRQYNILRVNSLYTYRLLSIYKTAVTMNNAFMITIFRLVRHESTYNIRHSNPWILPFSRTKYRTQSLSWNLPKYLNILDSNNFNIRMFSTTTFIELMHLLEPSIE